MRLGDRPRPSSGCAAKGQVLDAVSLGDLRRTLGDDARKCEYIETIPKRGYRLVARVSAAADASTEMTAALDASATSRDNTPPSLVVLPFANFGPTDDRYFCDGLTEEIINGLARFPGLRVISRTSAFAAHSQGGDISVIGSRLGVTHAIEGSVRRSGDRIRVTAQRTIEAFAPQERLTSRLDERTASRAHARRRSPARRRADERHGCVPVLPGRASSFPERHP